MKRRSLFTFAPHISGTAFSIHVSPPSLAERKEARDLLEFLEAHPEALQGTNPFEVQRLAQKADAPLFPFAGW